MFLNRALIAFSILFLLNGDTFAVPSSPQQIPHHDNVSDNATHRHEKRFSRLNIVKFDPLCRGLPGGQFRKATPFKSKRCTSPWTFAVWCEMFMRYDSRSYPFLDFECPPGTWCVTLQKWNDEIVPDGSIWDPDEPRLTVKCGEFDEEYLAIVENFMKSWNGPITVPPYTVSSLVAKIWVRGDTTGSIFTAKMSAGTRLDNIKPIAQHLFNGPGASGSAHSYTFEYSIPEADRGKLRIEPIVEFNASHENKLLINTGYLWSASVSRLASAHAEDQYDEPIE